ncbi:MAG TPA: hypothetical protein VIC33_06905 [Vicinamibacterales bacterium]|jgi:predicted ArsR family transcriptional regulator
MDPPDALPAELRAFLFSCIESITQVELLLLLRGSDKFRGVRDLATDLRIPPAAVRRDLETLAARGLLEIKVSGETLYRYGPKTDELRQYGDQLAQHYITSRHLVLNFVSTHARSSARRFADAFKLRDKDQ